MADLDDVIADLNSLTASEPSRFADGAHERDPREGDELIAALRHMPDTPQARRLRRALRDLRQATVKLQRAAETYDGCEAAVADAAAAYVDELRARQ